MRGERLGTPRGSTVSDTSKGLFVASCRAIALSDCGIPGVNQTNETGTRASFSRADSYIRAITYTSIVTHFLGCISLISADYKLVIPR